MLTNDVFISVILPCQNVDKIIYPVTEELLKILENNYTYFEIIFVDNHSEDSTKTVLDSLLTTKNYLRVIRLNRNYGQDLAISAGLDSAIGDVVVVLDPKEDPLTNLAELIAQCHHDCIILYGVKDKIPRFQPFRSLFASLFEWYCLKYLKINIQSRSGIFRVFNRSAINAFMQVKSRSRNLRILVVNVGFPVRAFTYKPLVRQAKQIKIEESILDDIHRGIEIIVSTSQQPMRFLTTIAVSAAFLNLIYCGYVAIIFLLKQRVAEGWITLSVQSASMFFLLFLILSLLSEYIGRILLESIQAPAYVVENEKSSTLLIDSKKRLNIHSEREKPTV